MALLSGSNPLTTFRLALAQINCVVGDIEGNCRKILDIRATVSKSGADIVLFPELALSGYPPEDLLLRPVFLDACRKALDTLALATTQDGPALLVGLPFSEKGCVYNAIAMIEKGYVSGLRYKQALPNNGVFDEKRVFVSGPENPQPLLWRGISLGLPICEDIWSDDVPDTLAKADLWLIANASPYWRGKGQERLVRTQALAMRHAIPLTYLNMVGGQDELVFDGASFIINGDGECAGQLPAFQESVTLTSWHKTQKGWSCNAFSSPQDLSIEEADYSALMLGLRDYVSKSGFSGVLLGLSGGIDSALVAALATDALGPDSVSAFFLPYTYSSSASHEDAHLCAKALGIFCQDLPIHSPMDALKGALKPILGEVTGLTQENLQSRTRGTLLMALSNALGTLLLTTGNKSELATGYATLYGDMNGAFNPLKDLWKTDVYHLARLRNFWKPHGAKGPRGEVIPSRILTRPPSAELRPDQTDQDSLPPYPVLDAILEVLVERQESLAQIVARGFASEIVQHISNLLKHAEYKRRQSPPGSKITHCSFGRDWRYPLVNHFKEEI
jgi:NAD+ synthase